MNKVQRNEWSCERSNGWEQESLASKQGGCDLCSRRQEPSHYTRGWRVFLTKNHDNPAAHSTAQASLSTAFQVG
jgi:hypothetical protein